MRLARPEVLIDLSRLAELDYIRETKGGLAIGATTTKRAVEDSALVKSRLPMLEVATRWIAHPQIRNRGTVGGSMAHADPAAEYPALAMALDAEMSAVGPKGERSIKAADFFVTYLTTALEPAEVLTEVRFPVLSNGTGWSFTEVARRHGDFALAGAAVTAALEKSGRVSSARIVLFGVGATPLRAVEAERIVAGETPSESLFEQAGVKVGEEIEDPLSDVHASAEYRRHLAQVLTRRGLAGAVGRAGGAT
jgi:carbon-monoxide dehydrogenase medium subunit